MRKTCSSRAMVLEVLISIIIMGIHKIAIIGPGLLRIATLAMELTLSSPNIRMIGI